MTTKFQTEETLNQGIQTFVIGNWHTKTLPQEITISQNEKSVLESYAKEWPKNFNSKHSNWMTTEFNVPSCIIRFDYVLDQYGVPQVFEIEDRPAGFEINALVSKEASDSFLLSLDRLSNYAKKPIGICISQGRMFNSDDFFWVQRLSGVKTVFGGLPQNPESHIWFVRSLRTEKEYYSLSPYSISTIEYEGDKSYGVGMGLWENLNNLNSLSWDKPFVVKPDAGCRCENVHMYHPQKPGGGFSTRSKIEKAILNGDVNYIQNYHSPEHPDFLPDGYSMIRRCYLVFNINDLSYKVIGGQWESRPKCHKIHGASDAVCGPLIL